MHSSPYMYLWRKKPWIRENFCGESAPNFIWWVICLFLTDGSTRQLTVHGWMKTIWKRLAKRSIWRRFAVLKKDYYNGGVFRFHDTFSEPWSPKRVHDRPTVCEKQMGARTFWWCMMSHHGNLHGPIRDLEYIYMSNFFWFWNQFFHIRWSIFPLCDFVLWILIFVLTSMAVPDPVKNTCTTTTK